MIFLSIAKVRWKKEFWYWKENSVKRGELHFGIEKAAVLHQKTAAFGW